MQRCVKNWRLRAHEAVYQGILSAQDNANDSVLEESQSLSFLSLFSPLSLHTLCLEGIDRNS